MLIALTNASNYLADKPNFLTPCVLEDPQFGKCLSSNLQNMFVEWRDGVPGTNTVGSLDPLLVKRIKFSQDTNSAIALNVDMQNVYIKGARLLTVKEASYNPSKHVAAGMVFLPKLRFDFDYKVKGQVLALPLNGHGNGLFEIENLVIRMEMAVKPRSSDVGNFADVQRVKISIPSIGNFRIKLNNLFPNSPELNDAAHTIFNENWRELYEVLQPTIQQTLEAIILDRTKKIFNYVPATYFIQDFH
ncbi:hypothetical protein AWZ03_008557 [Drosophila navojoa]|uniref:Protein takeout n=2 Tax=Drosophila navojoa TaxID=7232 RepID=A0A484B829_DRONA|nr:hypothetical protein AWZ03_008557 [Drosophila navojoa]